MTLGGHVVRGKGVDNHDKYVDEHNLLRHRFWMILTVLATHGAGALSALLGLGHPGEPWGLQLRLTNPLLSAWLALLVFSAVISVIVAVVVSLTHLCPATAWVLAVLAAPATLGLLTVLFVAART